MSPKKDMCLLRSRKYYPVLTKASMDPLRYLTRPPLLGVDITSFLWVLNLVLQDRVDMMTSVLEAEL